mgnify:CR=1 FL=1
MATLSDDKETEIEIKNERFDRAVAEAVATQVAAAREEFRKAYAGANISAWMAGRDDAKAAALAEADTQHAAENGQVWVNCANHIADKISKLVIRVPT